MLFTIVSERRGETSRETRASAQDALVLASTLVQGGVEKVWVFDARGAFVSASALSGLARRGTDEAGTPTVVASGTTDLLARAHEPVRPPTGGDGSGPTNGRVFRMAAQRS